MEQSRNQSASGDSQASPLPQEGAFTITGSSFTQVPGPARRLARPNRRQNSRPHVYWSPTQAELPAPSSRVTDILASSDKDLQAPITPDGKTMLHWASMHGKLELLRVLLSQDVAVNVATQQGVTPLHLAAEGGHAPIVESLICHGANIQALTAEGLTPLYCAARSRAHAVVDCLLLHGVDINAPVMHGMAPLHFAASEGQWSVIELLLNRGANIDVETTEGYTPLWFAVHGGYSAVVDLLRMRGASVQILSDAAAGNAGQWLPAKLAKWFPLDRPLTRPDVDYSRHITIALMVLWLLFLLRGCRI